MDRIKSIEEIEELITTLEGGDYLSPLDRDKIAHYIRYSVPFKVVKEMERPVFAVLELCEEKLLFLQETHDARNALARLYGYQVLQYVKQPQ